MYAALTTMRLANSCAKMKIHVLLELNGHIELNRYRALTRKPAPIQVSYYNCSATCGVPNIDYALIGEEINIENLQPYYSETIFHKKGVFIGTPVGAHFPPVSPPPFLKNGYITSAVLVRRTNLMQYIYGARC